MRIRWSGKRTVWMVLLLDFVNLLKVLYLYYYFLNGDEF